MLTHTPLMFTLYQSFANPEVFGFSLIVLILSMVVVGGLGSIPGVLIGVVLLGLLPELMRTTMAAAAAGSATLP